MDILHEKAYAILNPDDILTLKKYKFPELQKQIQAKGGSIANFISPYDLEKIWKENNNSVILPKHISEGDVIIATGENSYTRLEEQTVDSIISAKITAIDYIVYLLGGRSFKAKNYLRYHNSLSAGLNVDGGVNANIPSDGETLPVQGDRSAHVSGHLTLNSTAEIGIQALYNKELTLESYNDAINVAKQYNLWVDEKGDPTDIQTLIRQRKPNGNGGVLKRTYYADISSSLKAELQLTYSLKEGVANCLNVHLNVDIQGNIDEELSKRFEFEATFSPIGENKSSEHEVSALGGGNMDSPMLASAPRKKEDNEAIIQLEQKVDTLAQKVEEQKQSLDSSLGELSTLFSGRVDNIKLVLDHANEEINTLKIQLQFNEDKIQHQSKYLTEQIASMSTVCQNAEQKLTDITKSVDELKRIYDERLHNLSESNNANAKQIDHLNDQTKQLENKIESEHVILSQTIVDTEAKLKAELNRVENDFEAKLNQVSDQIEQLDQKIEKTKSDLLDTINSSIAECKQLIQNLEDQFQKQSKKQRIIFYATTATIGAISIASLVFTLIIR